MFHAMKDNMLMRIFSLTTIKEFSQTRTVFHYAQNDNFIHLA